MKKLEKNDKKNIIILLSIILIYLLILLLNGKVFGSKIDWANQHIVFPEYFRDLFYKNKTIIPEFSLNLGMGQNIFYISYYGLLSPIILLSYLFPFIPTYIYMPLISIVSLMSSVVLFYSWINDKYNSKIALITSLLFMLNSTFIYHFHRHIMFVIYMPFLLLALRGVDIYFKNKKILPLIINLFFLIMSSYYFGAYSAIVVGIYTIYKLLKNKKFDFKKLSKVVYLEIIAILLSCVLLLPTLYALINGRVQTTVTTINIFNLFSPLYNYNYTFYNYYYSWGLSFIYVLAIIFGFLSKKKNRIFISLIMSLIIIFPIFSYILNGGMYVDGKCYLPFLPLALLQVCDYIEEVYNRKININDYLKYIIPVIIFLLICSFGKTTMYLLIIDILLSLLTLSRIKKINNKNLVFLPTIIITITTFIISSINEQYIDIDTYKNINNNKYYELSKFIDNNDLYRLSIEDNKEYTMNKIYNINNLRTTFYSSLENINYFNEVRNTYQNEILNRDNTVLSQSSNVLFNIYSGSKYLISSNEPLIGYKKIKTIDNTSLYENEDVLPIIYASNKTMSKREFDELGFPYQLDALLNYVIIPNDKEYVYKSNIEKIKLDYNISNIENFKYFLSGNHIIINASKNAEASIKLNTPIDKILIIKFKMNKSKEGFACSSDIKINGINNSLSCSNWKYNNKNTTFEYVLSSNDIIDNLEIELSPDEFDISDIETYIIDYDKIKSIKNNINKINYYLDNNKIVFNSDLKEDNYIKTTIPYEEKGYKVLIDNKEIDLIKVDNAYIGFIVPSGKHNIEIIYNSPYLKEGKMFSLVGLCLLIITILFKNKK